MGFGTRSDVDIRRVALDCGRDALIQHRTARGQRRGSIAFSHGAESNPDCYDLLIEPWRDAGYDIWSPHHVDSRTHPLHEAYPGLATWRCRIEDMQAVSALIQGPYIAAGHSYGALTALVRGGAAGEVPEGMQGPLRDPQVRCVVALSPPPPIPKLMASNGYSAIAVPALIQTGDEDLMPGWPEMEEGWRVHLAAYEQAPAGGDRYLAVLGGVDHYFGNAICEPSRDVPPQLEQLRETVQLTKLFMSAYFPGCDAEARKALHARLSDAGGVRLTHK